MAGLRRPGGLLCRHRFGRARLGLDFMALGTERHRLAIRREHLDLAGVQRLPGTLCQAVLRCELETLCAYDTAKPGSGWPEGAGAAGRPCRQ